MFTVTDARVLPRAKDYELDNSISNAVYEADSNTAHIKVWWDDGNMQEKADNIARELQIRGFTDVEVHDRDSFRYAEVWFSW